MAAITQALQHLVTTHLPTLCGVQAAGNGLQDFGGQQVHPTSYSTPTPNHFCLTATKTALAKVTVALEVIKSTGQLSAVVSSDLLGVCNI